MSFLAEQANNCSSGLPAATCSLTMSLWTKPEQEWRESLDSYETTIKRLSEAKEARRKSQESLETLDRFVLGELPQIVTKDKYLAKDQLSRLMTWKLKRGKFRPRLQALVDSNGEEAVRKATESIPTEPSTDGLDRLTQIVELKGVGPATASVILSLWRPDSVAFMSDEAMAQIPGISSGDYTEKSLRKYCSSLRERSTALRNESEAGPSDRIEWNPFQCEKALFAAYHADNLKTAPTRKRKR
eukprot:Plantae.Rhodophyta-Rhodochaete_pulchella.ctg1691.p2 GENE.Plantae.Rhodophyta-Rhodochaete_pulchella.ctg1691~~Plantae.Rhodophyta-Rhodochaete_pulchella.ctg1691.p2  ORF type:complete len:243 (+),score=35.50 Plantae.Rhodophyta-Rhodochaete_pulchella.ctg1691:1142-1870(+)